MNNNQFFPNQKMQKQYMPIPSMQTLLTDLEKETSDNVSKNSVFLAYYHNTFQIINASSISVDRQKQLAKNYIKGKDRLAFYNRNGKLFCTIQPYELDILQDSWDFQLRLRSQEKEQLFNQCKDNQGYYLTNYYHGCGCVYPKMLRTFIMKGIKQRPSKDICHLIENYYAIPKKQIQSTQILKFNCKTSQTGTVTSVLQKEAIKVIGYNKLVILAGAAGVGKTKTACNAAIQLYMRYKKTSILGALTFAASKSLAIHMIKELEDFAKKINLNYKEEVTLMEEFENLIKNYKHNKYQDIELLSIYIKEKIQKIQSNKKKNLSFLFHNGLVQLSDYFISQKLLRYFSFNSQVLINLIKLNENWPIIQLLINLDKIACKKSTSAEFHEMYKAAVRATIKNTSIIVTNTVRAPEINDLQNENERFLPELAILDEARQASLIDTYCLLSLDVKKLILIGDQYQFSLEQNKLYSSLKINALEIFDSNENVPRIILTHIYRMSLQITLFNQFLTYGKKIAQGNQKFTAGKHKNSFFKRPIFMVTHNVEEQLISKHQHHGHCNLKQVDLIKEIIQHFKKWNADFNKIAILTFYNGQIEIIKTQFVRQVKLGLTVSTVGAFQGGQQDYVIVSCVRSNKSCDLGYTDDKRFINVAFTRPRRGLIILGNHQTLLKGNKKNSMWKHTWKYLAYNDGISQIPSYFFIQPPRIYQEFQKQFDDLSTEQQFNQEEKEEIDRMTSQQIKQFLENQRNEALEGNEFDETVQLPFIASNQR